jgi:hypothetical protein
MEAIRSSETSVNTTSTQCHIPEDCFLQLGITSLVTCVPYSSTLKIGALRSNKTLTNFCENRRSNIRNSIFLYSHDVEDLECHIFSLFTDDVSSPVYNVEL